MGFAPRLHSQYSILSKSCGPRCQRECNSLVLCRPIVTEDVAKRGFEARLLGVDREVLPKGARRSLGLSADAFSGDSLREFGRIYVGSKGPAVWGKVGKLWSSRKANSRPKADIWRTLQCPRSICCIFGTPASKVVCFIEV